jgi:hypothetical protein
MAAKASTFRIDSAVQKGLEQLSQLLKRPMNQLVTQAVKEFVRRRTYQLELETESTLARLRAYRLNDPDFQQAINAVAQAESRFAGEDPAQGELIEGRLEGDRLTPADTTAPIQAEIHRLLQG